MFSAIIFQQNVQKQISELTLKGPLTVIHIFLFIFFQKEKIFMDRLVHISVFFLALAQTSQRCLLSGSDPRIS